MTKLYELLAKGRKNGDFGIEIECEGERLPLLPPGTAWNQCDDGSLRGEYPHGRSEYVLRKPLSLDDSIAAIMDLIKHGNATRAKFDFSFRTSVHVHMNVLDMRVHHYLNMVYTYYIIEESLIRYCGDERIGNRFCLRLRDADFIINQIGNLFGDPVRFIHHLNMEELKYAAINLAATARYGSVEFRGMAGNINPDYIRIWLKALYNLREFSQQYADPRKIHDLFVNTPPSKFLEMVLGDVYRFFSYENETNDMRTNFSLSLDLPYMFREVKIQKEEVKPKAKRQRIQELAAGQVNFNDPVLWNHAVVAVNPVVEVFGQGAHAIIVDEIDEYDLTNLEWAEHIPQQNIIPVADRTLQRFLISKEIREAHNEREARE